MFLLLLMFVLYLYCNANAPVACPYEAYILTYLLLIRDTCWVVFRLAAKGEKMPVSSLIISIMLSTVIYNVIMTFM